MLYSLSANSAWATSLGLTCPASTALARSRSLSERGPQLLVGFSPMRPSLLHRGGSELGFSMALGRLFDSGECMPPRVEAARGLNSSEHEEHGHKRAFGP